MQRLLGSSPTSRHRCRLIEGVRKECKDTEPEIGQKYRRIETPTPDYEGVDSNEGWDSQDAWQCPRRGRFCSWSSTLPSPYGVLHRSRLFLAIWSSLHLEGQDLADGGSTRAGWKSFDVDEYLLSPLSGLQKAESTLVVPSLECSGESHAAVCVCAAYPMQISRCSGRPVYPTRCARTPRVDADTKSITKASGIDFSRTWKP